MWWECKLTELGADSTDSFASVFDNSHIESEQYYMNILSADLKPIVSDLRSAHMKDNNTASDIDYQSMIKNIIDAAIRCFTKELHKSDNYFTFFITLAFQRKKQVILNP